MCPKSETRSDIAWKPSRKSRVDEKSFNDDCGVHRNENGGSGIFCREGE